MEDPRRFIGLVNSKIKISNQNYIDEIIKANKPGGLGLLPPEAPIREFEIKREIDKISQGMGMKLFIGISLLLISAPFPIISLISWIIALIERRADQTSPFLPCELPLLLLLGLGIWYIAIYINRVKKINSLKR